jgi:hypothetical protein
MDMGHKRSSLAFSSPMTIVSSSTRILRLRLNLRLEVISVSVRFTVSKIEEVSEQDLI